jgi:hypothetical protein
LLNIKLTLPVILYIGEGFTGASGNIYYKQDYKLEDLAIGLEKSTAT